MRSVAQVPRVLVVNPNTNTETTAMLLRRFTAASGPGVGVSAVTALHGPPMITTPDALADAARHVVDAVLDALDVGRPDAVVIGAFGDPGVAELRGHARLSGIPVTGIGEASLLDATSDGRRFAIATTTGELAGALASMVERIGVSDLYTGLELTETAPLVLASSRGKSQRELAAAVERATAKGAQRVVIGGGPLSDVAGDLGDEYPGVIVEPVAAAARWAVGAVR